MPRSLPAWTSSRVMDTSSGLGVGSPARVVVGDDDAGGRIDYGGAQHLGRAALTEELTLPM